MYAIIATGGKQYKVSEGDVIKVEKLNAEAGNTVTFDNVIAVSNDSLKVGADVANATVTATVMEQGKKSSFTSTIERLAITKRTVIDKHTHRLRLTKSTLNRCYRFTYYDYDYHL